MQKVIEAFTMSAEADGVDLNTFQDNIRIDKDGAIGYNAQPISWKAEESLRDEQEADTMLQAA